MVNVLINGISGNMGQEVLREVQSHKNFSVVCGIDRNNVRNNPFPIYNNVNNVKEDVDVIIDFSVPVASINMLKFAQEKQIPVVIATTGFSEQELNIIKDYSLKIPIFKASNMSYEINIMADIVSKLSLLLKDSDIEIIETHHNQKIDSPSGTALILADRINNALDNKMVYEYNRQAKREKRTEKEIGIHSIRGGSIVGKHTVAFFGKNETLEITHTSNSKSVFAAGALRAAKFIINQKNGLYDMKDLSKDIL